MDRQYIAEMRQQRGWGINPWATHTRFIISQALVRDEARCSAITLCSPASGRHRECPPTR